jgi:hypothetical protein
MYEGDLGEMLGEWEEIQFKGLREVLIQFLRTTSYKDRRTGLAKLVVLLPAIVHFEGKEVPGEILRAVIDTAGWWP